MHLNTKKIAFAGVMLALTEVGIALWCDRNEYPFFLLAAASFFVGIVIQEFGLKSGQAFYWLEFCWQSFCLRINYMWFPMHLWDFIF